MQTVACRTCSRAGRARRCDIGAGFQTEGHAVEGGAAVAGPCRWRLSDGPRRSSRNSSMTRTCVGLTMSDTLRADPDGEGTRLVHRPPGRPGQHPHSSRSVSGGCRASMRSCSRGCTAPAAGGAHRAGADHRRGGRAQRPWCTGRRKTVFLPCLSMSILTLGKVYQLTVDTAAQ